MYVWAAWREAVPDAPAERAVAATAAGVGDAGSAQGRKPSFLARSFLAA